ncbi:DnaT-like ssDNA-binding protein [Pyxidicoccus caerfyrddinensis]|uniref:DnaT-like ssDNA-binding protein n=1 Tax=Pyxidicoccus caerfyrddinensis TaxID=2709663 RepID=UPI0013DB3BDF|nr:DnaT-like ssDNA-binding protein [Pyxidicoccus caerfyrddinensis]
MPLDATPGGPAADSYCTVAEADAYHSSRGHNTAWRTTDVAAKEQHLKWATRLLDAHFTYVGARASAEQALAWPRRGVVLDGCPVSSASVPLQLKGAAAEFAFRLLQEDWTAGLGPVVDEGVQVGPLRTSPERHVPIPAQVATLVRRLVQGGTAGLGSVEVQRG